MFRRGELTGPELQPSDDDPARGNQAYSLRGRRWQVGLEVGDRVPDVAGTTHDGRVVRLSEMAAGGPLVVFFYPKAFTPGCTAQTCHFRDLSARFAEVGATVVGASRDTAETQERFAEAYDVDFPLLADRDGSIAKALGAKRRGPLPSRRQTVVLAADLTVLGTFRSETNMNAHADEALALLSGRDRDGGRGGTRP